MKKILFLILVLSTLYAGFIGYKLIVKNKTPFVFKCEVEKTVKMTTIFRFKMTTIFGAK